MKGGTKFKSLIQGRHSIVRQNMSRRLPAFRGQILLRPELRPDQIILPHTWQHNLPIYASKLVDITDPTPLGNDYFQELPGILAIKRDPVININAYSFVKFVAFSVCDNIFIGPGEIENKNADFDGDTQTAIYFDDPSEVLEIKLNAYAKYNMKSFKTTRVKFTESHALIMVSCLAFTRAFAFTVSFALASTTPSSRLSVYSTLRLCEKI